MIVWLLAVATAVTFEDASSEFDGVFGVSIPVNGAGYTGVAVFDYDADGDLDLYFGNGPGQRNTLLQNDGAGHFTDVTVQANADVDTGTGGVLAADLDNDGYPELVLAGDRSSLRVLGNAGNGTFIDQTVPSGLDGARRNISAHAADIDDDGDVDVYVGGGIVPSENYVNTLWQNNGDRTFTEVAATAGVATNLGMCAASFTHFDDDDAIDLVVANCNDIAILPTPFEVYRNRGDGTFEDVYDASRMWAVGHFMALAWGDYDGNGWLDFFSTNVGVSKTRDGPHALYMNNGDGTWTDAADSAGVAAHEFGWGAVGADFDNDGWDDIYYAGRSHADDQVRSPGLLFTNLGDGTFSDPEIPLDLDAMWTSGLAHGDFDGNGFPDLVVVTTAYPQELATGKPVLLMNQGNANHWLTVRLTGTTANAPGIGARIRVTAGGRQRLHEVRAGDSYLSTSTPWPTFGLGGETNATVCVRWPDGTGEDFGAVTADTVVDLVQGAGVGETPCLAPVPPDPTGDTGPTTTDGPEPDTAEPPPSEDGAQGCGCNAGGSAALTSVLCLVLLARRRAYRDRPRIR